MNSDAGPGRESASVLERVERFVWGGPQQAQPGWQHHLSQFLRLIWAVGRDVAEGQITLRAMSLVYTTLLSLVPLLAISFSILKGFGVHNQIEPFLLNAMEPLGERKEEIVERIVGFVDNVQVGVLGSIEESPDVEPNEFVFSAAIAAMERAGPRDIGRYRGDTREIWGAPSRPWSAQALALT